MISHYGAIDFKLDHGLHGLGILLTKGLKKKSPLIKFDFNKVINNKQINFGLFL